MSHLINHHFNRYGVCTTCALVRAMEYADHNIQFMGYRQNSIEKKRKAEKMMWDEFYMLTTPSGRSR